MQELCNQQYKNVLLLYSDEDQKEEIESEFYQYMNDIEEIKPEI